MVGRCRLGLWRKEPDMSTTDFVECLYVVANDYGCNGDHDSDLIASAFRRLATELEAFEERKEKAEQQAHSELMQNILGDHGQG